MALVFADTSGLVALLVPSDPAHDRAERWFGGARHDNHVTHNYVVTETIALVQRRHGVDSVGKLVDVMARVHVDWVDEDLHQTAVNELLRRDRRRLSLVDCVSFEVMRRRGITDAFAFDDDFEAEGFTLVA